MPNKFDKILGEYREDDAPSTGVYLKIDQSTPQTVINGRPIFNAGTMNNDDVKIIAGKKLIFDGA